MEPARELRQSSTQACGVPAGGVVVAGLLSRKAEAFAELLDGNEAAGAAKDPALNHLAGLTQRLSAVPGPSAPFRAALRDQLVSAAANPATAASAAAGAAPSLAGGHAATSGAAAGHSTSALGALG